MVILKRTSESKLWKICKLSLKALYPNTNPLVYFHPLSHALLSWLCLQCTCSGATHCKAEQPGARWSQRGSGMPVPCCPPTEPVGSSLQLTVAVLTSLGCSRSSDRGVSLWPLTLLSLDSVVGSWCHFGVRSNNPVSLPQTLLACLFNRVLAPAAKSLPQEMAWDSLGPVFYCVNIAASPQVCMLSIRSPGRFRTRIWKCSSGPLIAYFPLRLAPWVHGQEQCKPGWIQLRKPQMLRPSLAQGPWFLDMSYGCVRGVMA